MRRISVGVLCVILAAILSPGCQKLRDERKVQVAEHEVHAILYDPPKREQQISILVRSSGEPVNAYLVLEKDRSAVAASLQDRKTPEKALSRQEMREEATLEATIPAKEGFAVLLTHSARKAVEVTVKATSK